MRKQLVALTLSAAMAAGMLSGCGGYGSGSGGQKDAAEAAGTAAGAAATTAAAGSDGTAEPAKASTADGEPIQMCIRDSAPAFLWSGWLWGLRQCQRQ